MNKNLMIMIAALVSLVVVLAVLVGLGYLDVFTSLGVLVFICLLADFIGKILSKNENL